jgi:nucleotide-binding universal stress UspA family protein
MKEIIVAIDFSKGSLHALDYAIELANHQKSNLTMVWVDNNANQEMFFSSAPNEFREEAIKNLDEIIASKKPKLKSGKLSYKLRKGKVYQEIANQAKANNAELIIAGTHGVTGYEEFWIGSNAYRIVSYAPCPVITVRYDFEITSRPISSIVLPIDNTLDTRQKVPFTIEMAKIFNADIYLLSLYSTPFKAMHKKVDNYTREAQKKITEAGINQYTETIEADNITNATIKYAQKVNASLIAIISHTGT